MVQRGPWAVSSTTTPASLSWSRTASAAAQSLRVRAAARCSRASATSESTTPRSSPAPARRPVRVERVQPEDVRASPVPSARTSPPRRRHRRPAPRCPARTTSCTTAIARRRVQVVVHRRDERGRQRRRRSPGADQLGRALHEALQPPVRRRPPRAAPPRSSRSPSGSAGWTGSSAARPAGCPAPRSRAGRSTLPSDLPILAPPRLSRRVVHPEPGERRSPAALDWAISFSWCGKTRSRPPPWMSNSCPRYRQHMAEHSMCQPGRPRPPRRGPLRVGRLVGLGALPQGEVARVALGPRRARRRPPAWRRPAGRTARRSPRRSARRSRRRRSRPRPGTRARQRSACAISSCISGTCPVARGS